MSDLSRPRVVFAEGERVILRPLERADAATIQPWVNDPEVTRTLLLFRPLGLEAEMEFIDQMTKSEAAVAFGLVDKADGALVGVTGLTQIDTRLRHASFGIFIGDKARWGRGLGTEATALVTRYAFETLNLNRVWLHVAATNLAGIRAYEKVGYQREGLLRQHLYRGGRYIDIVAMGIVRAEWPEAGPRPPTPRP